MPLFYIRHLTSRRRTRTSNRHLGFILAFVAGAINAGGFLAIGKYTSHMTGILSAAADHLALRQLSLALSGLYCIFAFTFGSMCTAILVNWARRRRLHSQYALSLFLEAILLLSFGLVGGHLEGDRWYVFTTAMLLCYIMGLQNSIITKISRSEIRTTHVTGIVTDIGIELGKWVYWNRNKKLPVVDVDYDHLWVLSRLLLMFGLGGFMGALWFKHVGFLSTLPLAAVLLILAGVPVVDDVMIWIKKNRT